MHIILKVPSVNFKMQTVHAKLDGFLNLYENFTFDQ